MHQRQNTFGKRKSIDQLSIYFLQLYLCIIYSTINSICTVISYSWGTSPHHVCALQLLLPSLHNHGLLSSSLVEFEELWCTVFPHFPLAAAWYVWSACTCTVHLFVSVIYNEYTYFHTNLIYLAEEDIFSSYLHIKPPLSHFLRESVFSGKSSSGRCRTSTRTDNSAWTNGRRRSSRADTMSYSPDNETSLPPIQFHTHK